MSARAAAHLTRIRRSQRKLLALGVGKHLPDGFANLRMDQHRTRRLAAEGGERRKDLPLQSPALLV